MKNLIKRTITGLIFVALIIGSIIWNQYSFVILFLVITIFGLWEFYSLVKTTSIARPQILAGIFSGGILFISMALVAMNIADVKILLINLVTIPLIFFIELFSKNKNPFTNISFSILGIIYIALPFSLLNFFFNIGLIPGVFRYEILLGFFIIIWMHDIFAYLTGITLGRHLLFKRISPKKTWEGSFGGVIFAILTAYIISLIFYDLSSIQWVIIALIITVFGTLGDLTESMFKRSMNIKDTGNILPGHGGILDRFDAVLMAVPFVYIYLKLII